MLEPTAKIKAVYEKPFRLSYVVTLAEHQLSSSLHVQNTSTLDVLEFQALFHSYIRAPATDVIVGPLWNKSYYDKTEPTEEGRASAKLETRTSVDVKVFTDSVYEDASQHYEVTWPGGGLAVRSNELKDLVIWNPQRENGMKLSDMEEGGWYVLPPSTYPYFISHTSRREHFVCVEPGHVRGFVKLEPGKTWIGQQVLTVIHDEKKLNHL